MASEQITARLSQFQNRFWTREQFEEWYKIDFDDLETQRLLVQMQWFGGTHGSPSDLGTDRFDHWHFERFLQRRELEPVSVAAAEWAMSVEDFRAVCDAFLHSPGFAMVGSPGESKSIVRRSFLRDFHKGFDRLRRTLFASHTIYIDMIHEQIRNVLGVFITRTEDRTDQALRIRPPRPGYRIDCITKEPVGMGHEVYLNTPKPMELRPDCCSWLTFSKHREILEEHMLGSRSGLDEETIDILRAS